MNYDKHSPIPHAYHTTTLLEQLRVDLVYAERSLRNYKKQRRATKLYSEAKEIEKKEVHTRGIIKQLKIQRRKLWRQ